MSQLKNVVDPFGEVNVYPASAGRVRVVATILMQPHKEGAQTGLALDGSGSMRKLYGLEEGRVLSPIFGGPKKAANDITLRIIIGGIPKLDDRCVGFARIAAGENVLRAIHEAPAGVSAFVSSLETR